MCLLTKSKIVEPLLYTGFVLIETVLFCAMGYQTCLFRFSVGIPAPDGACFGAKGYNSGDTFLLAILVIALLFPAVHYLVIRSGWRFIINVPLSFAFLIGLWLVLAPIIDGLPDAVVRVLF